ncbi:flagellin [Pseudothermotoga sp. U03pept]|uniref:flagellin n=1 Tax=Pseudothermotoga sp. U03pept TaxID=3447012 RepID=UPI003F0887C6
MRINDITNAWMVRYLDFLQNQQRNLSTQLSQATIPFSANVSAGAISQKIRAQITGYQQAMSDVYNAIGMMNVAEGGLNSIRSNLQRMRELAVQASNSTLSSSDRAALAEEFRQLQQQINKTSEQTQYNNTKVLQEVRDFQVQTGPNEGQKMSITISPVNARTLGVENLNLSTPQNAQSAIEEIDKALEQTSNLRSYIGATTNRLGSAAKELSNTMINLTTTVSNLTDTDMARTMMEFIRSQLMTQSSISALSHSNLSRLSVLRLLNM